jgi:midasin
MALYTNNTLDVVNLSQDSDSTDLIGGYKPIGTLELLMPLIEDVEQLIKSSFDTVKNPKFLSHFTTLLAQERFFDYLMLAEGTAKKAIGNKCGDQLAWADVLVRCQRLSKSLNSRKSALPFAYVEGIVSKAAKNGHWLLIDEINLASSECLDAIIHVFDGSIQRHPNFRLFACMNPATDTGKKKLPVGIRTRFTEFFVNEPTDRNQLTIIVRNYLPSIEPLHLGRLLNFYKEVIELFPRKYSLRNLCRALSFASDNLYGNLYRSLFEGVSMAFGSDLDNDGMTKFNKILSKHFEGVPTGVARGPVDGKKILVEGSYIEKGDNTPQTDPRYIYTESIKKNLLRLSRTVASGRFPILLEGETSAGKTSMILDLALVTGNIVHRINNHEHTDIQEYIGCYAPDENGKLIFVEGVLLQAVRQGHWVILDELNLAPIEVLEALNRLLDDNRELFVAERNLVVKAHPRFRLFATQNPVGTYAGRKRLSRAFLNRFVVLRFDHPPFEELTQIVCARCGIANSPALAMIKVLTELKRCRSNTGLFNASDGLMLLMKMEN